MLRRVLLSLLLIILLFPPGRAYAAPHRHASRTFQTLQIAYKVASRNTGISNGGLSVFGYPITPTYDVITPTQVDSFPGRRAQSARIPSRYSAHLLTFCSVVWESTLLRLQNRDWQTETPGQPKAWLLVCRSHET